MAAQTSPDADIALSLALAVIASSGASLLVLDGDLIELDVAGRRLHLQVSDEELAQRRSKWRPPERRYERGFGALYTAHVTQAEQGCDFDFLHAGAQTPEPEIH